jgi:hypothetical protein
MSMEGEVCGRQTDESPAPCVFSTIVGAFTPLLGLGGATDHAAEGKFGWLPAS